MTKKQEKQFLAKVQLANGEIGQILNKYSLRVVAELQYTTTGVIPIAKFAEALPQVDPQMNKPTITKIKKKK